MSFCKILERTAVAITILGSQGCSSQLFGLFVKGALEIRTAPAPNQNPSELTLLNQVPLDRLTLGEQMVVNLSFTNNGQDDLSLESVKLLPAGIEAQVNLTNNCSLIKKGLTEACPFQVRFEPKKAGAIDGYVQAVYTKPDGELKVMEFPLIGALGRSEAVLKFQNQSAADNTTFINDSDFSTSCPQHGSCDMLVKVWTNYNKFGPNSGLSAASAVSFQMGGSDAARFQVSAAPNNSCLGQNQITDDCYVKITFNPNAQRTFDGKLVLGFNNGSSVVNRELTVSAVGGAPITNETPRLLTINAAVRFTDTIYTSDNQAPPAVEGQNVMNLNVGVTGNSGTLILTQLVIPTWLQVLSGSTCPTQASGSFPNSPSCTYRLKFNPTAYGELTTPILGVTSPDLNLSGFKIVFSRTNFQPAINLVPSITSAITIAGRGIHPARLQFGDNHTAPASYNFGPKALNSSNVSSPSPVIRNCGGYPVGEACATPTNITLVSGTGNSPRIAGSLSPLSGVPTALNLTFTPDSTADASSTFTIRYRNGRLPLSGEAVDINNFIVVNSNVLTATGSGIVQITGCANPPCTTNPATSDINFGRVLIGSDPNSPVVSGASPSDLGRGFAGFSGGTTLGLIEGNFVSGTVLSNSLTPFKMKGTVAAPLFPGSDGTCASGLSISPTSTNANPGCSFYLGLSSTTTNSNGTTFPAGTEVSVPFRVSYCADGTTSCTTKTNIAYTAKMTPENASILAFGSAVGSAVATPTPFAFAETNPTVTPNGRTQTFTIFNRQPTASLSGYFPLRISTATTPPTTASDPLSGEPSMRIVGVDDDITPAQSPFSFDSGTCANGDLAGGSSCTRIIKFNPSGLADGTYSARLKILYDTKRVGSATLPKNAVAYYTIAGVKSSKNTLITADPSTAPPSFNSNTFAFDGTPNDLSTQTGQIRLTLQGNSASALTYEYNPSTASTAPTTGWTANQPASPLGLSNQCANLTLNGTTTTSNCDLTASFTPAAWDTEYSFWVRVKYTNALNSGQDSIGTTTFRLRGIARKKYPSLTLTSSASLSGTFAASSATAPYVFPQNVVLNKTTPDALQGVFFRVTNASGATVGPATSISPAFTAPANQSFQLDDSMIPSGSTKCSSISASAKLAPNSSCFFYVKYNPSVVESNATQAITISAIDDYGNAIGANTPGQVAANYQGAVRGSSQNVAPTLSVTLNNLAATAVSFTPSVSQADQTLTLVVKNTSSTQGIDIEDLTFTGVASPFSIVSGATGDCVSSTTLVQNATCNLRVRFQSSTIAQYSGSLAISYKDGKGNQFVANQAAYTIPSISLSGRVMAQIKIFANYQNTCILDELQKARCWGDNVIAQNATGGDIVGKLGLGASGAAVMPALGTQNVNSIATISLGSSAKVSKLAIGKDHICALVDYPAPISRTGVVSCWGRNDKGQLGYGNTNSRFIPALLGTGSDLYAQGVDFGDGIFALDVASGGAHSCAILSNGKIKCWGDGSNGQLGTGSPDNRGDGAAEMGQTFLVDSSAFGAAGTPEQIAVGASHSCAKFSSGAIYCWGNNYAYQLGNAKDFYGKVSVATSTNGILDGTMSELQPIATSGASLVTTSLSTPSVCYQTTSGLVKCLGKTSPSEKTISDSQNPTPGFGALLGTCFKRPVPTQNATVAACNSTAAELANFVGRNSSEISSIGFMGLAGSSQKLVMGGQHICVLLSGGSVQCWGAGSKGQLGLGTDLTPKPSVSSSTSAAVTSTSVAANAFVGETILDIAAGESHTCVVTNKNKVRCFGQSQVNALGNGSTAVVNTAPATTPVYSVLGVN